MKVFNWIVLFLGMISPFALKGASQAAPVRLTPAVLQDFSEEMRTNHPGLRSFYARIDAAEANVRSVRVWEDPQVMAGGIAGKGMMREEDGDLIVGVEQKLPLFGKWQAQRALAQRQHKGKELEADYQFQMLRLELTRQLFKTALAEHLLHIGSEDLSWLTSVTRVAEERYGTGTGSQVEVLRMQTERSKRARQFTNDSSFLSQEVRVLNRLLNRPLDTQWPSLELPDLGPPVVYNQRVRNLVLKFEARLKLTRQRTEEAEAAVMVARRQRRPDVMLAVEERRYSGTSGFREGMVSVRFNLPWVNERRYKADEERERHLLRATELEMADYELFVPLEAQRVITMAEAARSEAVLYREEIIPRSEMTLRNIQETWSAGRGNLFELLDARRILLESRSAYSRAVAQQYQALIELVLCCGLADLGSLEMLKPPAEKGTPTEAPGENSPK